MPNRKIWIASAIMLVVVIVALAAVFGVFARIPSAQPAQVAPRAISTRSSDLAQGGIFCTAPDGATGDCVSIWNGGNISVYSNQGGSLRFSVNGDSGNVNTAGVLSVKGTPIAYATAIPTPTPANTATPQPTYAYTAPTVVPNVLGYGSSGKRLVCGSSVITGTDTIAHGLATPSFVVASLGQDVTYDGESVSFTNAAATVTLKVWGVNVLGTPVAAATPAAVDWCVLGTP